MIATNTPDPDALILIEMIKAKFDRIATNLSLRWGEREFPVYVNSLISDGRPNRRGFPFEIMSALITLRSLHDQYFPEFMIGDPDNWNSSLLGPL